MDGRSVFYEEWLNSLREQYKQTARNGDKITLPSLTAVMQNAGFGEAELTALRLEATMRVEDVASDFVADSDILNTVGAHPAECLCPQCATIDESAFDAEGQPKARDPEEEAAPAAGAVFPIADFAAPEEEAEPLTFADSLATEAPPELPASEGQLESGSDNDGNGADEADETAEAAGADKDGPLQISLY